MTNSTEQQRREASRWLRAAAAAVLKSHGSYLEAGPIWNAIARPAGACPTEAMPPGTKTSIGVEMGDRVDDFLCRLRRSSLDDGPAILARLLTNSSRFAHYREQCQWFGLVEWPAGVHRKFYDQRLHEARSRQDSEGMERAASAIFSLELEPIEREAYRQIVAELRRQLDELVQWPGLNLSGPALNERADL